MSEAENEENNDCEDKYIRYMLTGGSSDVKNIKITIKNVHKSCADLGEICITFRN